MRHAATEAAAKLFIDIVCLLVGWLVSVPVLEQTCAGDAVFERRKTRCQKNTVVRRNNKRLAVLSTIHVAATSPYSSVADRLHPSVRCTVRTRTLGLASGNGQFEE